MLCKLLLYVYMPMDSVAFLAVPVHTSCSIIQASSTLLDLVFILTSFHAKPHNGDDLEVYTVSYPDKTYAHVKPVFQAAPVCTSRPMIQVPGIRLCYAFTVMIQVFH